MKLVIQIVLWIVIIFLGWKLYNSVMGPVEFNKVKEARYAKVIENLKDIQAAELAHKEITGSFTETGIVWLLLLILPSLPLRKDATQVMPMLPKTKLLELMKVTLLKNL